MKATEHSTRTALWVPGWYELDQPLCVGENGRLWFYQKPPRDLPDVESYDFVFFNQLSASANCQVRTAEVLSIEHPVLGNLARIDTDGLDYVFHPVDGVPIVVNAEEDPGCSNENAEILDWSVSVRLGDVSEPVVDAS